MSAKKKIGIVGSVGTAINLLWGGYAFITTAAQLPSDATRFAQMLADPPLWLPWALAAIFAVMIGWAFWPSSSVDDEPLEREPAPSSFVNHGVFAHGNVFANDGPAIVVNERKFDLGDRQLEEISQRLNKNLSVSLFYPRWQGGMEAGRRLSQYLQSCGFIIDNEMAWGQPIIHQSVPVLIRTFPPRPGKSQQEIYLDPSI